MLCNLHAPEEMRDKGYDEQNQEDKKQYLRDPRTCARNTAEAERASDKRDHEENQSPVKHKISPFAWSR
jgi:hypothetical protein